MSFSIIAFDKEKKIFGSAVASGLIAIGGVIPVYRKNIGLIHTQADVFPLGAQNFFSHMENGKTIDDSLATTIEEDKNSNRRQYLACDINGKFVAFTGDNCEKNYKTTVSDNCVAGGNMILRPQIIDDIASTYEENLHLNMAERLLLALKSVEKSGGDKRGSISASLAIFDCACPESNARTPNLRIDYHDNPIEELERIYKEFTKNGDRYFAY